jgi:site-specific recombinase XerC
MSAGVPVAMDRASSPAAQAPATLVAPCASHVVPALIADAGETAGWQYVEFFTANIRNPHTRRAYARACSQFFAWCEERGLTLTTIRPFDVAAWVEQLQQTHSAPGVKQQLAAVRMLFDWLLIGQSVPTNPSSAVRGPKHVVKTGTTPVLDSKEWRKLIDAIPIDTVRDLRDRALIATLTYSFARIAAALTMKVEDLRPKGAGWQIRLHEKGGKHHTMPLICPAAARWSTHSRWRRTRARGPQSFTIGRRNALPCVRSSASYCDVVQRIGHRAQILNRRQGAKYTGTGGEEAGDHRTGPSGAICGHRPPCRRTRRSR